MSTKISPENFPEIIEVYNKEGKTAAYDLIRSKFGIKNPTCVLKRIKKSKTFPYNPDADCFEASLRAEEEDIFMNLEELCTANPIASKAAATKPSQEIRMMAMEKMVHSLISDRLLEISKYVLLDPIGNSILIDKTAMQADGYCVSIN